MNRPILRTALCILIAAIVAGCEPVMRDMQYRNIRTGTFPMIMDLNFGRGQVDAGALMKSAKYVGTVEREDVAVRYGEGMEPLARRLADTYGAGKAEVRRRTGVTWAFRPVFHLVEADHLPQGVKMKIHLHRNRELALPILVHGGSNPRIVTYWMHGIAHELTESSMLAALSKRELVLGDYCVGRAGLVNDTRWFRDGVSDYAGNIFCGVLFGDRYQPPAGIYRDLARVRAGLLDWTNCDLDLDSDSYYSAGNGLAHLLAARYGDDAVARILHAASGERYINGRTLRRAVADVTGADFRGMLRDYRPAWLGVKLEDTRPSRTEVDTVDEGNQVRITSIYPNTPASRWKLQPGDLILSADGHPVVSSAWLSHHLAPKLPGDRVRIVIERAGERIDFLMKLGARDPSTLRVR